MSKEKMSALPTNPIPLKRLNLISVEYPIQLDEGLFIYSFQKIQEIVQEFITNKKNHPILECKVYKKTSYNVGDPEYEYMGRLVTRDPLTYEKILTVVGRKFIELP